MVITVNLIGPRFGEETFLDLLSHRSKQIVQQILTLLLGDFLILDEKISIVLCNSLLKESNEDQ